ncbi:MAG TPA: hypothetical protein VII57_02970 [Dehalococcoidia bacterium]
MAKKQKPRRRKLDYFEAQDKVMHLANLYRTDVGGSYRARTIAARTHAELDDTAPPEPDAELEDSELSDVEQRAAIARERMRREGRL